MSDPFLWLEELTSEKSLEWVKSQNQKTLAQWAHHPRFEELRQKSLELLSEKDRLTVGTVFQGQVYHVWKDAQNPLGLWRRAPLESLRHHPQWEVLLDLDQYSKQRGQATFLNQFQFLKNSSRVLLSLSPDGKDACEIFEWDLQTKDFVSEGYYRPLSKGQMTWIDENHVFWSSDRPPSHCGYTTQIYSWRRGESPELIYQVPVTSMSVWGMTLHDGHGVSQSFVGHNLNWDDKDQYHWQDRKTLVATGLPASAWIYGIFKDRLVIWIEKDWMEFRAGSVLVSQIPGKFSQFRNSEFEVIFEGHGKKVFQDLVVSCDSVFIFISDNLKNEVLTWDLQGLHPTHIPHGVTVSSLFSSVEKDQCFCLLQSFSHPPSWYQWKDSSWKMAQSTRPHFAVENIVSRQEWATSQDGTKVPYWVVYDSRFEFPRPTLQVGYGGFLLPMFPEYVPNYGSLWMERGGVFVLSQIRGGSEFGPSWHQAARLENKQKSYDDFIAISEDLIRKGYTTSKQLAIRGRSNGGLLVGATITQRPDLYGAAIIEVPLLDMIRYVELPPGSSWADEYGDPRDPKFREVILKYSPYQNIEKNSQYPPVLVRTARSDDRVHPGHARKFAAKMQSLGHPVWFYEEELGGHGSTPVKDQAFQNALVFEFLWSCLQP